MLSGNYRNAEKRGEFFWLTGITIQLLYNMILMKNLFNKEKKVVPKISKMTVTQFFQKIDRHNFLWR